MGKTIARSVVSSKKEIIVYYKEEQNGHYYVNNDRYEHSDYALINLEKKSNEKKEYWWV